MVEYFSYMYAGLKILGLIAAIFGVYAGFYTLVYYAIHRVYPKAAEYSKDLDETINFACLTIGAILTGLFIVPAIVAFVPPYENPAAVAAEKACRDVAFAEGQSAAENGIPCEACPYGFNKQRYSITATIQYSAWMKGWTSKTIELKKGENQ